MTNLLDASTADGIKTRLRTVRADSPRQWGTMTAPQAVAHCVESMKTAVDDVRPKRMLIGHVLGPVIRRLALGNEAPLRRNSPTSPDLVVRDDRDLDLERDRLVVLIDRFVAGGRDACTKHPHTFFGRLTAEQWGELMYKHLDHHLRQFGA